MYTIFIKLLEKDNVYFSNLPLRDFKMRVCKVWLWFHKFETKIKLWKLNLEILHNRFEQWCTNDYKIKEIDIYNSLLENYGWSRYCYRLLDQVIT